jgi:hypothetical protein
MRARLGKSFRASGNLCLTLLGVLSVSLPLKPTTPSMSPRHSHVGKTSSWLHTLKSFDLLEEVPALEASGIRHEGDLAYLGDENVFRELNVNPICKAKLRRLVSSREPLRAGTVAASLPNASMAVMADKSIGDALALKEKGNAAFVQGQVTAAMNMYTEAYQKLRQVEAHTQEQSHQAKIVKSPRYSDFIYISYTVLFGTDFLRIGNSAHIFCWPRLSTRAEQQRNSECTRRPSPPAA